MHLEVCMIPASMAAVFGARWSISEPLLGKTGDHFRSRLSQSVELHLQVTLFAVFVAPKDGSPQYAVMNSFSRGIVQQENIAFGL